MDGQKLGELIGASIAGNEELRAESFMPIFTDEELLAEVTQRKLAVASETGAMSVEATTETETSTSAVYLSKERQERAEALKRVMAEKFGLSLEDFGLVRVETDEAGETLPEPKVVVMLTSGNGLNKGSFNKIMDKKSNKDFVIELNGQKIDTRKAMTWDTYQAFILQAKASRVTPLPDSSSLSKQNDQPWTVTWLTGEQPDEFDAPYGDVYNDWPRRYWLGRNLGGSDVRVRPAAVV